MASSEERLRELLAAEGPLSDEARQEIEHIFSVFSEYSCMQCMINDYSPSSRRLQAHSH